ncbi:MAG: MgtC/SapB family protein [Chloroflexota bacterium]|nr:MgtC/SapB family protein [Chloroflexota bacterium]
MYLDTWTMICRIIGALVFGGIVGYERETEQKPAGLRTIMLVTLGAALLMLLAQRIPDLIQVNVDALTMDPTRILGSLVQGIGFLGAGTIFLHKSTVHGLTTAAAIWTMAVVGAAVGIGDWSLSIMGTVAAFFILRVLGPLSFRIVDKER